MYDDYDNLLPVRRVVGSNLSFPVSSPLSTIASQLPQEALNHLDRVRCDDFNIAKFQDIGQTQRNLTDNLCGIGNQFLARRSENQCHLRVKLNTAVNPTFFGGGDHCSGSLSIDIW